MVAHLPSRFTRAFIASLSFKAAMAFPAWCSSQNPTTALANNSNRIMPRSGQCLSTAERIAAISIIQGMGPQKYERNFRNWLGFLSFISLVPYMLSRSCASSWRSPSGDDPNSACSSDIGRSFRLSFTLVLDSEGDPGVLDLTFLDFIM